MLYTLHLRECVGLEYRPVTIGKLSTCKRSSRSWCLPAKIGEQQALTAWSTSGFCRTLVATDGDGQAGRAATPQAVTVLGAARGVLVDWQAALLRSLNFTVTVYGCSALELPKEIGELSELQDLRLRACSAFTQLPPTFGANLPNLTTLNLTLCSSCVIASE